MLLIIFFCTQGNRRPSRAIEGHRGLSGAIPGPSGAIRGRWTQVYFSPAGIVHQFDYNNTVNNNTKIYS